MANLGGLLNVFGDVPSYASGLLSEEELDMAKARARSNALLQMGKAFYEAGAPRETPGGSTLSGVANALLSGKQAYQGAVKGSIEEKLNQQKVQQALDAQKRTKEAQRLAQGIFTPATPAQPAAMIGGAPYGKATPAQPGGINQEVVQQLMAFPEGRAILQDVMGARKAMQPQMFSLKEGDIQYSIDPFSNAVTQIAAGTPKVVEPKLAGSFAEAVDALGLPRKNASQYTEPERLAINQKMNQLAQSKRQIMMDSGQKGFENTSNLKKQFASEPIYKAYEDMKVSYGQVSSAIKSGTPIGDTAAATKIMKLLDPGSVVRETELGMAMAATGKMDLLKNYFENYMKGTKLTTSQRAEFQSLADELFNAAASAYNSKRSEYENLGREFGLNTDVALGKPAKVQGTIKRIGW